MPQRKGDDSESERSHSAHEGTGGLRAREGLFRDLGIVEPDDNPLSCLADEENSDGRGRPQMRFLVAPVDPKLAVSGLRCETHRLRISTLGASGQRRVLSFIATGQIQYGTFFLRDPKQGTSSRRHASVTRWKLAPITISGLGLF